MALKLEIPTSNEWHVLKGETQYGPYTYEDMITMMQEKTLFGFDYVWAPHLDAWTLLSDLAEFSADRLHMIAEKSQDSDVFHRRKHSRAMVHLPVFVHDNKQFWKGVIENLSEGGALIRMENPLLLPGDFITLHFRSHKDFRAFNCTAEILTKRLTKQKIHHDTNLYYAVKFNTVHKDGVEQIKDWVHENTQAKKAKSKE